MALAERDRRVVSLHLPDNSGVTLRMLAQVIQCAIEDAVVERELELFESFEDMTGQE